MEVRRRTTEPHYHLEPPRVVLHGKDPPDPLAVPPGTAACVSSDLVARFTGDEGVTGGQLIGGFVFSDRSGTPCEVSGTPAVHLLGASGAPIKVRPGPDLEPTSGSFPSSGPIRPAD